MEYAEARGSFSSNEDPREGPSPLLAPSLVGSSLERERDARVGATEEGIILTPCIMRLIMWYKIIIKA